MNLETSLTIAAKELKVIRRRKSAVYGVLILPLFLSVLFSLLIQSQVANGIPPMLSLGLDSLTYFFVVLSALMPSSIAAYSIVGEKVEKSLEPLLATPSTDGEILLGKSLAAFVFPMLATWSGAAVFMAASDYLTLGGLSYYYFPNWVSNIMLLLLAPLAAITGIELGVIVSSRVTDIRGANQISGLMFLPFILVFIAGVSGTVTFSVYNLLIISLIVLLADVGLFFLSKSVFRREDILTKWK